MQVLPRQNTRLFSMPHLYAAYHFTTKAMTIHLTVHVVYNYKKNFKTFMHTSSWIE